MESSKRIEHFTDMAVRAISNSLAPSCIGCPFTRQFVSADRELERDGIKVKISARCDKMTMLGPACPDGGQPGSTYLKDLGIPRKLGEQQFDKSFVVDRLAMAAVGRRDLDMFRAPNYVNHVKVAFEDHADEIGAFLHNMDETINFVNNGEPMVEPILWNGETKFETLDQAKTGYVERHVTEYDRNRDEVSLICEPTSYMKEHFPEEYQRHFGVMTEYERKTRVQARDEFADVKFVGDFPPPTPPPSSEPELAKDEIYDDWGTFA